MQNQVKKSFGFLKTTAIGGLIFLLPLVVIGALLGYVYSVVEVAFSAVEKFLPFDTALGFLLVLLISLLLIALLCFVCGLLARRAFARQFSAKFEKQLTAIFPKYAIYKDILAGSIGGQGNAPTLKPIVFRYQGLRRLAFEADRLSSGEVVVYAPGAPDSWNGTVLLVSPQEIEDIDVPFSEFLGVFERLGRDSRSLLQDV